MIYTFWRRSPRACSGLRRNRHSRPHRRIGRDFRSRGARCLCWRILRIISHVFGAIIAGWVFVNTSCFSGGFKRGRLSLDDGFDFISKPLLAIGYALAHILIPPLKQRFILVLMRRSILSIRQRFIPQPQFQSMRHILWRQVSYNLVQPLFQFPHQGCPSAA